MSGNEKPPGSANPARPISSQINSQGSYPKREQNNSNPDRTDGLLAKYELLKFAMTMSSLSSCDMAVLSQLLERYNHATGNAWPSFERLAGDTGRSKRAVQNSVKRLEKAKLIKIEHGGRTQSNRYKPMFGVWKSSAIGVGQPASSAMEVDCAQVWKPTATESSYQPVLENGLIGGVPDQADALSGDGAGPALGARVCPVEGKTIDEKRACSSAGGPDIYAQPLGRKHEWFWEAYPPSNGRRTGPIEDALDELLAPGIVTVEQIHSGALTYAEHLAGKPGHDVKYTRHPLKWLEERGWFDEYPKAQTKSQNSKGRVKEASPRNEESEADEQLRLGDELGEFMEGLHDDTDKFISCSDRQIEHYHAAQRLGHPRVLRDLGYAYEIRYYTSKDRKDIIRAYWYFKLSRDQYPKESSPLDGDHFEGEFTTEDFE